MGSNIIKRAISGDPEALSSLINSHRDIAYNLAISIVKNREDARDITQESFLKVLERIHPAGDGKQGSSRRRSLGQLPDAIEQRDQ